jgi:lipid-binding SYLF domain-containing protein
MSASPGRVFTMKEAAREFFAGVSLDGAVVQADKSGDQAEYGANVTSQEILDGHIQVPSSARLLIHELRAYPGATVGM